MRFAPWLKLNVAWACLGAGSALGLEFGLPAVVEGLDLRLPDRGMVTNLIAALPSGGATAILEKDGRSIWTNQTAGASLLLTNLSAGRYFLTLAGSSTNDYGFSIRSGAAPPANDLASNPAVLSGEVRATPASTSAATAEAGEAWHAGREPKASLWWRWFPSKTGHAVVHTHGSPTDTVAAVYDSTGRSIAANDDAGSLVTSQVSFWAQADSNYLIALDGEPGEALLSIIEEAPPSAPLSVIPDGATFWFEPGHFSTNVTYAAGLSTNLFAGDHWLFWETASASGLIGWTNIHVRVRPRGARLELGTALWRKDPSHALFLHGAPGGEARLQYSPDLASWTDLARFTNFGGSAWIIQPASIPRRFYRSWTTEP